MQLSDKRHRRCYNSPWSYFHICWINCNVKWHLSVQEGSLLFLSLIYFKYLFTFCGGRHKLIWGSEDKEGAFYFYKLQSPVRQMTCEIRYDLNFWTFFLGTQFMKSDCHPPIHYLYHLSCYRFWACWCKFQLLSSKGRVHLGHVSNLYQGNCSVMQPC